MALDVWAGGDSGVPFEEVLAREVEVEGGVEEGWFWCRYLPTWGFAGIIGLSSFKTEAALPRAFLLTPASLSFRCSSVSVLTPSCKYLKALRFRLSTFWGSCSVMISLRPNSSSLTRSLHIFALIFSRSTVS